MLSLENLSELLVSLGQTRQESEARTLVRDLLESHYGRGSVAFDKDAGRAPLPKPTSLNLITSEMVESGLYHRECSLMMNELFIVEAESGALEEHDLVLLDVITDYYRLTLARLAQSGAEDPLTGLAGSSAFHQRLDSLLAGGHEFCLIMLDLDNFAAYNAAFGTAEGDQRLLRAANLLLEIAGPTNSVYRLSGDEFAVLMPASVIDNALHLSEQVREAFEQRFGESETPTTGSLGVAAWTDRSGDKDDLLKATRDAMFTAWRVGGNRVCACRSR